MKLHNKANARAQLNPNRWDSTGCGTGCGTGCVRQIISFFINYCYYGFHILNSVKMKIIGVMKTKSQRLHF